MFRLPVCPHCRTVYSYKEVKKNNRKSIIQCYHCKKNFKNGRAGIIVLALIICIAAILINIFVLNISSDNFISIIPISVISVIAVLIGILLVPFFISYKKVKEHNE